MRPVTNSGDISRDGPGQVIFAAEAGCARADAFAVSVQATEVARRAGHVAVLLKIYVHCIDGQADAANQRITDALGALDAEPEPGDEEDGHSEQAS